MTIAPIPYVDVGLCYVGWKYFEVIGTIYCSYEMTGSGFQHRKAGTATWTTVNVKAESASYSAWIAASAGGVVECRSFLSYQKPMQKPTTVYSDVIAIGMLDIPTFSVSCRNLTCRTVTVDITINPNGNRVSHLWIYRERLGHGVELTNMLAMDVTTTATFSYDFAGWCELSPETAYSIYPAFQTNDQYQADSTDITTVSGVTFTTPPDPAATTATPTPTLTPTTTPTFAPTPTTGLSPTTPSPSPSPAPATTSTAGETTTVTTRTTPDGVTPTPGGTTVPFGTTRPTTRTMPVGTTSAPSTAESQQVTGTPVPSAPPGDGGNSNTLLYVLAGVVGTVAVGTAVYFGIKMRKGKP